MRKSSMILAGLLLASCNQSSTQRESASPDQATNETAADGNDIASPAPAAATPTLDGQWSVASAKGTAMGGMVMTFAGGTATIVDGCVRRTWSYTQKGAVVAFKSVPSGNSNCHDTTVPQEQIFGAVGDANMAIFADNGGKVSLSGFGGGVSLTRR